MKTHNTVSSQRRKNRKAHFASPSHIRRKLMSVNLSRDLKVTHGIKSLPIRKDDEVKIVRGGFKGQSGKVQSVYRKKMCLYVEKVTKQRVNGAPQKIPVQPSNCVLVKIKMNKDRQDLIRRKQEGRGLGKGKYTQQDVN